MLNNSAVMAALRAVASDNRMRFSTGQAIYWNGGTLTEILDAAALDPEAWTIGETVYVAVTEVLETRPPLRERIKIARDKVPQEIYKALDVAASDEMAWLKGLEAWNQTGSVSTMLDAAADDPVSWKMGRVVAKEVKLAIEENRGINRILDLLRDDQFAPRQLPA